MSQTPISSATICMVRRVMRAAFSVGMVYASSKLHSAIVWVPESAEARAKNAVRAMLSSGCSTVRPPPPPPAIIRSTGERGFLAPYCSLTSLAHSLRPARSLATCSRKLPWMSKLNERRLANSSTSRPRAMTWSM